MTLDSLDLFPQPAAPRPGAAPARRCLHPRAQRRIVEDGVVCGRCGREIDPALSVRGRNNRSRGNRDELAVARLLGGRKVGPLGGPHDVEIPGYLRLQCKRLDRWPSLARVLTWIDVMQPHDDVRGVTVADTPGPGGRTRRLLIVDLDEYARWHGAYRPMETNE